MKRDAVLEYIKKVDQAATVGEACRMAVEAIAEHTRYSNPSFFLVGPEGDTLDLVAHVGFIPGTISIPRGNGISWRSLETGKPSLIEDITKAGEYVPGLEGSCCEINVPVIWRKRKIGVFSIESITPGAFTADDLRFANLLAAILGSVIVHLETEMKLSVSLEEVESTAKYRSLFLELSMELFSMKDREASLERVVEVLGSVMDYEKVFLFLRENSAGPIWLRAFRGKDIGEKAIRDIIDGGKGLTGRAIRSGEAVFCNDTRSDPDFYLDDERTLSEAVIPIRSGEILWGVLVVDEYRTDAFSRPDREQLLILAGMIGVVLENIDHLRRIREDLDLMERLHRIIASVAGEKDIRSLCRETVRLLKELTRYHFVEVFEVVCEQSGQTRLIAGNAGKNLGEEELRRHDELMYEKGGGLAGECARSGKLLNVPDVRRSKHYAALSSSTRSELDVPILFDGKTLGVLSLESDILSAFSGEDERVMSIIAGHLGALWAHNELLERTERLALQDPLTGLWNRRFIFDRLESEASRCGRYGCVFSVVMIDLRNFKMVNDRFGHPAGDRVLVEMSSFFRKSLRDSDIVSRYGGDEFLMLLPETDFAEASRILERLAKDLDSQRIRIESVPVLFDCGISSFPADGREVRALIQTADERLYCEKASRKSGGGVRQ